MASVFSSFVLKSQPRLFVLSEAERHLPLLLKVTAKHFKLHQPVNDRLQAMLCNDPRRPDLENEYQHVVNSWKQKIEMLGLTASGLWEAEFDMGECYLVWKYPQSRLSFVILKSDKSFGHRMRLSDYIRDFDPDWAWKDNKL